jgi:hypothetical protein
MAIEQQISQATTGGASLGQSATDKISFYGVTPIVQPTVATAGTDLATVIVELTSLRAKLALLGLIA